MWDISLPLVSWKVIRSEPQTLSSLWSSSILIEHLWIRMSLFSTIWRMEQSWFCQRRASDCSSWNWVASWRNLLIRKNLIKNKFLNSPSNPNESIQETDKDMNNKKIVNLANQTSHQDAVTKNYVDEKTETSDLFTFLSKHPPRISSLRHS